MITQSRLAEVRKRLFGRKLAKRPKPPNEAERLYLGAARVYADTFKQIVGGAIAETYPELLDPANVRTDFNEDQPRDESGRWAGDTMAAHGAGDLASKYPVSVRLRDTTETLQGSSTDRLVAGKWQKHIEVKKNQEPANKKPALGKLANIAETATTADDAARLTLLHEYGHVLHDYASAESRAAITKDFAAKPKSVSRYARASEREHFAEAFTAYLRYPAELKAHAPSTHAMVEGVLAQLREKKDSRLDARVGPLMLGKHASKVLAHITNPLRAAQDRIPLDQVAGTVRGHVERDVQRYMPGLKNTDLFLGGQIAGWRRDNVGLISSMTDDMLEKIGNLLEDYDGTRVEDTATALEDTFGLTRARAELIARDQVLKLNADMNQQAQTNAGVDKYRWSTSQDGSVRDDPKGRGDPNHVILESTIHSWDDPPVTCERTGDTNHPGQDYQCRCVAIPVLEEFDDAVQAEESDENE